MNDIDLHIHTLFSDGTDDCEALIAKIRKLGIKIFSVTDHDNIDSILALQNCDLSGLTYILGAEFSCIYKGADLHLLGYSFDVNNKYMQELVEKAKQNRQIKIKKILDYLQSAHEIVLSKDDINSLYNASGSVGKPHFANILIKMGFGSDIHSTIKKYLLDFSTPELKIDVLDAILAIKKSGGICVAAHPIRLIHEFNCSYSELANIIADLKALGLDGLEVFYSRHTATDIKEFTKIAKNLNLLVTCGSDYHGYNKPDKQIGKVTVDNSYVDYSLLKPFLLKAIK